MDKPIYILLPLSDHNTRFICSYFLPKYYFNYLDSLSNPSKEIIKFEYFEKSKTIRYRGWGTSIECYYNILDRTLKELPEIEYTFGQKVYRILNNLHLV